MLACDRNRRRGRVEGLACWWVFWLPRRHPPPGDNENTSIGGSIAGRARHCAVSGRG